MSQNIYKFSEKDLEENKKGRLTAGQREWLRSMASGVRASSNQSLKIIFIFLIVGSGLIAAMFLSNESTRNAIFNSPSDFAPISIGLIILASILICSRIFMNTTAQKIEDAKLSTVEGEIWFDEEYFPNSSTTAYYVFVGKKRFSFSTKMFHTFQEKKRYRVYFCKVNVYELIMSYEKLT